MDKKENILTKKIELITKRIIEEATLNYKGKKINCLFDYDSTNKETKNIHAIIDEAKSDPLTNKDMDSLKKTMQNYLNNQTEEDIELIEKKMVLEEQQYKIYLEKDGKKLCVLYVVSKSPNWTNVAYEDIFTNESDDLDEEPHEILTDLMNYQPLSVIEHG